MTTWYLTLTPGDPGTIKNPGWMSASWGANKPDSVNPAQVGDILYVTFPLPSSALPPENGTVAVLLNLSWAASKNANPAVLAFEGSPAGPLAFWTCEVIPATVDLDLELAYVFRAIVVVNQPNKTEVYQVDPEMVVGDGVSV